MIDRNYIIGEINSLIANYEHGIVMDIWFLGDYIGDTWRSEYNYGKLDCAPEIITRSVIYELIKEGYLDEIQVDNEDWPMVRLPKDDNQIN